MKRSRVQLVGVMCAFVFLVSQNLALAAETLASSPVDAGNKSCPISGDKVDLEKGGTAEYQGKLYHFCCPMCKKDFLKDPEKYLKSMKAKEEKAAAGEEDAALPEGGMMMHQEENADKGAH